MLKSRSFAFRSKPFSKIFKKQVFFFLKIISFEMFLMFFLSEVFDGHPQGRTFIRGV
jgi:hypothetical protein